jgi:hypothetical protein
MKFSKTARFIPLLLVLGVCVAFSPSSSLALPDNAPPTEIIYPPRVEATLPPGGSLQVTKIVNVPDKPPKLDLFLIIDLSASYEDDLPIIKTLAPGLFDDVQTAIPNSRFGLGSFVDFPFSPWGAYLVGDYAYRLEHDLTTDKMIWLAAVNAMSKNSGWDRPESQYEALYQAATGEGREMPSTTNGDFSDRGEIAPGQAPTFRPDATKVVAIATDASFHTTGDTSCNENGSDCPFSYPGASRDETIAALNTAGIKVIGIKGPPDWVDDVAAFDAAMADLAKTTGGVVKTTDAISSEFAEAILSGLQELTFEVIGRPIGCEPLAITFDPPVHEGVKSGETVQFKEHITVPTGIAEKSVQCTVEFKAGEIVIGVQELSIEIEQPTAVDLVSFTVEPGVAGTAISTWETATEIDNAGFNLYRASSLDGPWDKINGALIAAKGDPVSGANYTFVDTPGYGTTFYYRLEDVDYFGVSTLYETVAIIQLTSEKRFDLYLPVIIR